MANKNEVMVLLKERIGDNDKLQSFVEKAKAITIPLFPETVQFTDPALKYGAAIVSVDLTLDTYGNNRDIYRNESNTYCLHLTKLNEIAQQSGLQIIDSRVLERKVDEKGRVTYIEHQVKWKLRSIDGSIKEGTATGKYDYFRDLEKYVKDGKPLEKMIKGRRTHAEALAESNALTRAYNKAIAKLPQGFTLDELKKPFLIPYVIEDKDELLKDLPKEDQLQIKKELARKRLGIVNDIYAAPGQKQVETIEAVIVDDGPIQQQQSHQEQTGPTKEEQNKILAEEFRGATQKERTEKISNLMKIKNYSKDAEGEEITIDRIEKNAVNSQVKFIERLLNLPDFKEVKEL